MVRGVSLGRKHWKEMADKLDKSGLSQTAFAEQEGISVWTLRAWLSRFADEAKEQGAAGTTAEGLDDVLVAAASKHGHLTSRQVALALKIPQERAQEYLRWLVEEGRLRERGSRHATLYLPTR